MVLNLNLEVVNNCGIFLFFLIFNLLGDSKKKCLVGYS